MHAEHDIVLANPSWTVCLSLCLSVCHMVVLYVNGCTYRQTLSTVYWGHDTSFFERCCRYKIQMKSAQGHIDVKYTAEIAIFDRNRPLSRKQYDRLGLAIVPLCHGTGAPLRRTQAPPGPFEIFLTCIGNITGK